VPLSIEIATHAFTFKERQGETCRPTFPLCLPAGNLSPIKAPASLISNAILQTAECLTSSRRKMLNSSNPVEHLMSNRHFCQCTVGGSYFAMRLLTRLKLPRNFSRLRVIFFTEKLSCRTAYVNNGVFSYPRAGFFDRAGSAVIVKIGCDIAGVNGIYFKWRIA